MQPHQFKLLALTPQMHSRACSICTPTMGDTVKYMLMPFGEDPIYVCDKCLSALYDDIKYIYAESKKDL